MFSATIQIDDGKCSPIHRINRSIDCRAGRGQGLAGRENVTDQWRCERMLKSQCIWIDRGINDAFAFLTAGRNRNTTCFRRPLAENCSGMGASPLGARRSFLTPRRTAGAVTLQNLRLVKLAKSIWILRKFRLCPLFSVVFAELFFVARMLSQEHRSRIRENGFTIG